MQRSKFAIACLTFGLVFLATPGANSSNPILPISTITPGATNPDVTQANIHSTICVSGYTAKIRPSDSYTTSLKKKQLAGPYSFYHDQKTSDFEEDHLISLEIGGSPTSPLNLWPEPYAGPTGARVKDLIENKLHELVCSDKIPLVDAQNSIATNWFVAYQRYILGISAAETPAVTPSPTTVSTPNQSLTPTASFSMPLFAGAIGKILSDWGSTGFSLDPVVVQETVPSGLFCRPRSDNDLVISQEPQWKSVVTSNTQITLTVTCSPVVQSSPTQVPPLPNGQTANATNNSSPISPLPTATASAKSCYVNGYTTKTGKIVKGYYRAC